VSDERPVAVLFDFNGVIVDDEPLHVRCANEVLAPMGLSLEVHEYFERYLGLDDRAFFQRLLVDRGWAMEAEGLAALMRGKAEAYHRQIDQVTLCRGAAEAIRSISAQVPTAVVSGAVRAEIESLLRRFDLAKSFQTIVAAEDVARGKPMPDGYRLALERLGRPQAWRCLAIEDAPAGLQAARAAGVDCWALSTNRTALQLGEATRVLDTLQGVSFEDLRLRSDPTVVAGVLEDNGRLLVCKRPEGGAESGKWEFPGGKLEAGETAAQGLVRELSEELHLRVVPGEELGRERVGRELVVFLQARLVEPQAPSLRHHAAVAWVLRAELDRVDLLDADSRFLRAQER
jgi:mutator protein MutT/HAD superfamily hydrolase (TIGR01509 family)